MTIIVPVWIVITICILFVLRSIVKTINSFRMLKAFKELIETLSGSSISSLVKKFIELKK